MTAIKPLSFFSFKHINRLYTESVINKEVIKQSLHSNINYISHAQKVTQSNLLNVSDIVNGDGLNKFISESVELDFIGGDISEQEYSRYIESSILPHKTLNAVKDIKDELRGRIDYYIEQLKTLSVEEETERAHLEIELKTNKELLNNQELINSYYSEKRKVLGREYNTIADIKGMVATVEHIRKTKVYLSYDKDKTPTKYIDNRQNFSKADVDHQVYIMYLKGKISFNAFKKYRKYGTKSESITQHLNMWLKHYILKCGHKKQYAYTSDHKNKDLWVYDTISHRIIKIKAVSDKDALNLTETALNEEIERKTLNDLRVFAYSKL